MVIMSQASKDRMGTLNNQLAEVIEDSKCTPAEIMAVLELYLTRLRRSFEVSVMPTTIGGNK